MEEASEAAGPDTEGGRASVVASRLTAAGLALTAGGLIDGSAGAVVATLAVPVLEHIIEHGNRRYADGACEVIESGARRANQPLETLPAYLDADPRRFHFATVVTRAALDTLDREKLGALAKVLAYGLEDDARIEMGGMYAAAIREMESPHIRVLGALVGQLDECDSHGRGGDLHRSHLDASFPGLSDGIDAVLAVLIREGLAYQSVYGGGGPGGESDPGYRASEFGESVYAWIRTEAAGKVDGAAGVHHDASSAR